MACEWGTFKHFEAVKNLILIEFHNDMKWDVTVQIEFDFTVHYSIVFFFPLFVTTNHNF